MRFSALMRAVGARGVKLEETRAGSDPEIGGVCEDSRKVRAGDIFVARGGTKMSGAAFALEAVAKGAVAVVSAEAIDVPETVAFARVGNANLALAMMAHEVAGNPTAGMKMIGVTGTKGKTTVAYLMRSVLKAAALKVGMVGTVEIDDGKDVVGAEMTTPGVVELVELFSRMKRNGVTHCVMEVSSHALHQDRVAGIDWAVGMFTNLTGDHLDYHGTMAEYGAAKAILFKGLGTNATAVVNVDDAWGEKMVEGCKAKVVRYGLEREDRWHDWSADILSMSGLGVSLNVVGPDGVSFEFSGPLVGRHNVYNTLCAMAAGHALRISLNQMEEGLDAMEGVPGRLQPVLDPMGGGRSDHAMVFVDYAHTHDSLENVLRALRGTISGTTQIICVFGCGGDRDRTKRPKMARVAQELADIVIVTSDNPRTEEPQRIIEEVCAGFVGEWRNGRKIFVEPDRREAIRIAIARADGDIVLIAGKGHESYQIVGTTKHHFDDVEEAQAAMSVPLEKLQKEVMARRAAMAK